MIDLVRERIKTIKGAFTSDEFKDIKNAGAALSEMSKRGEIKCVCLIKGGIGASRKVYIVENLREVKQPRECGESKYMLQRSHNEAKDMSIINNWKTAFPNWFAFCFKEIGRTIHKPELVSQDEA